MDYIQAIACAIWNEIPKGFFLDVTKTLIGTFAGAGLAFWFALKKDGIAKAKEQKAAGDYALTTLGRQASDFLQVKFSIERDRAERLKETPAMPAWMQIKPMHFPYSESLKFNLDSLIYLYEIEGGSDTVEQLINVEGKYHDFFSLLEVFGKTAEALQQRFSDAGIDPRAGVGLSTLEKVGGFALVSKADSLAKGIFMHLERTEPYFHKACEKLPETLIKKFGGKGALKIKLPTQAELGKIML